MANVNSLQLLRNGQLFASYEAAVAGIKASGTNDGVIKLARYKGNATDSGNTKYSSSDVVKTIFGIYNGAFTGTITGDAGWTIYDSYTEIIADLQRQIDAMGGESGSIREQIMAEIEKLDYSDYVSGDSKVVVDVTESDGVVAATGENIANIKLADYTKGEDDGKVAATDTLGEALSKLEKQVEVVSANTANVISGLDYSDSAVEGSYVSQVTETDGVIAVTRVELPTVAPISEAGKPIVAVSETKGAVSAATGTINAEYVEIADDGNNFSSTTVEATLAEIVDKYTAADAALKTEILGGASASADTLGELEALINNLEAGAATYSIRKDTENLPAEIKERYTLVETVNGADADKQVTIDLPKDSHIVSINYIESGEHAQNLEYVYIDASGNTQTTYVDMAHLILESEFASGVTSTNGVAHGVVDPTSENFLTVGAGGFKLDGVQDAIDAAVSSASTDLQEAVDELSGNVETLSAKSVTSIVSADGSITATPSAAADGTVEYDLSTDASKVNVSSNYVSAQTASAVEDGDSLDTALGKLEAQVAEAKAGATTVVEHAQTNTHVTVAGAADATDGHMVYTVTENDIASASDLADEIAARKAVDGQTGDTYAANANTNYIGAATDLNNADVLLDAAIKAVADNASSAQTEIDAIEAAVGLGADGSHQTSTGNYTSSATTIEGEIVDLDAQVKANADAIADLQGNALTGVTVNNAPLAVANNVASMTVSGATSALTATNGEAVVVNTDSDGNLTIGLDTIDAGTY